jgi:hypothetical protein
VGSDTAGQQPGLHVLLDLLALCEEDAFVGRPVTISQARALPTAGGDRTPARRPAPTTADQSVSACPEDRDDGCGHDDDHGDDDE